jgi:nitroimidazol reductase NimA-like FMN-containing flavoprotein (pyridoxamine 5'-phosphate oxidase superfamily)
MMVAMGRGEPAAARPFMPGYGTLPEDQGTGLLPWPWAEQRLRDSHDYWLATVWPDGRPHVMPVWGVWDDGCLWVSSSLRSRKARNLLAHPACTVTTDRAQDPVVLEGHAERVVDPARLADVLAAENAKYSTGYGTEWLDPEVNAWFRIVPHWAFGLQQDDFSGSPTKWVFEAGP